MWPWERLKCLQTRTAWPWFAPLLLLGGSRRCCKVPEPFGAKVHLSLAASCLCSLHDSVLSEALHENPEAGALGPSCTVDGKRGAGAASP